MEELWGYWGHYGIRGLLRGGYGVVIGMWGYGVLMESLWGYYGVIMGLLWGYYGIVMGP